MVVFVAGPNFTTAPQALQFSIPLPADRVYQNVRGIQFSNKSIWNVIVQGFAGSTIEIEANTHKYIPNFAPATLAQGGAYIATSQVRIMFTLRAFSNPQGSLDMHVFFEDDQEPSDPFISVPRALSVLHLGATDLVPSAVGMLTSGFFSSGSASTLTLDLPATGGPAFLTYAGFDFGVPSAAVGGEITLKDGAGNQLDIWHVNMGIAPMPGVYRSIPYPHPILGNVAPAGHIQYLLAVPAITSGPSYSLSLKGYD